jgi:hypothetical protein
MVLFNRPKPNKPKKEGILFRYDYTTCDHLITEIF